MLQQHVTDKESHELGLLSQIEEQATELQTLSLSAQNYESEMNNLRHMLD